MALIPRIQVLPVILANQIAAGEVIERPASVVKELIENSLDAGAHALDIIIENGGMGLIKVQDDGCGIHPEDMALALSRHATSKIASQFDLHCIRSLGFRGEALASISSIARLELQSCMAGHDQAWCLTDANLTPCAHPQGTTVIAKDLFYNIPARRKFLRSEHYELSQIEEIVKRLALCRFDIAIALSHAGRKLFHLPIANRDSVGIEKRIGKVFGKAFLEQALAIDLQNGDMRLWGWVGLPSYSRSSADLQYFYLNGRNIRDRLINHGIRAAYTDKLAIGRHPAFILYLEMDPSLVDVNVHPTKHEVRFRESRLIHDFVWRSIDKVIAKEPLEEFHVQSAVHALTTNANPVSLNLSSLENNLVRESKIKEEAKPLGKAIGIIHKRFLISENEQGMVLIDLPIIQRWLNAYYLKEAFQTKEIKKRPLLFPQQIKLAKDKIAIVEKHQPRLNTLGWEMDVLDVDTLLVRQAPSLLTEINLTDLIPKLLLQFEKEDSDDMALLECMAEYSIASHNLTLNALNDFLREIERVSIQHPGIKMVTKEYIPELFA